MKLIVAIFLMGAIPCLATYDKRIVHVLEQLRSCTMTLDEELPMIGGAAIGHAGTAHEFYLLMPYFEEISRDDDLRAMLNDRSPVVRIMGAACILKKKDIQWLEYLEPLARDSARVFVAPFGSSILKLTVAEVVREMKVHRSYFEGAEDDPPNKPVQRTGEDARR